MHKRILTLLTILSLSTALLIGCGSTQETPTQSEATTTTETAQASDGTTNETEATATPEATEEPHTHNYTEEITTDATCEADGLKTFTCECGDTYTETIPATEHIFENYVSNNDATYTSDGTETAKCNTCDLTDTRTAEGSKLEYTYTEMNATMYATQTVNVRNLPSTDGEKIGSLSTNQEITVLGQCNETSWYKFELDGQIAFVSNSYLSTEKVEVQQSTGGGSGGGGNKWATQFGVTLPFTATVQVPTQGVSHHLVWNSASSFNPDTNLICQVWNGTQVTISDFATYRGWPMAYVTLPDGTSGWVLFQDGSGYFFTW